MQAKPAVSVVIPCRNEVRFIESSLSSVLALEAPEGGFEVIVADGMSNDGTRALIESMAAKDARLRMVDNPARTTPNGLNAGIASAMGNIIVRIDAHTEYAPDYLRQCVRALEESGADNVGGPWVARGNTYLQQAIATAFHAPFAVGGARGHQADYSGEVDTVYLGCWRREVFDRIGIFDPELVRNQDDEFNFRLLRAGGKIWQSAAIRSWYTPRAALGDLFRQYWQYGYWKVRVIQKHRAPASIRHLIPGSFAASLLGLAIAAPFLPVARVGLLVLVGVYLLAIGFASIHTAARSKWSYLPVLPAIFACFHLGYGLGFVFGVWDFIICRRGSGRFVALTRR